MHPVLVNNQPNSDQLRRLNLIDTKWVSLERRAMDILNHYRGDPDKFGRKSIQIERIKAKLLLRIPTILWWNLESFWAIPSFIVEAAQQDLSDLNNWKNTYIPRSFSAMIPVWSIKEDSTNLRCFIDMYSAKEE